MFLSSGFGFFFFLFLVSCASVPTTDFQTLKQSLVGQTFPRSERKKRERDEGGEVFEKDSVVTGS